MEKLKVKKKRKKSREQALWNKILERDLLLNEFALSDASLRSAMNEKAWELEKKRNFKDYVR